MNRQSDEKIKIHTICVQTGLTSLKCVQSRSSQPGASKNAKPAAPEARRLCKAKFQLTNIEGGRFKLKVNSKEKGGREDEGAVKENQTLNLNMPDHSSTSCSGRGKNG